MHPISSRDENDSQSSTEEVSQLFIDILKLFVYLHLVLILFNTNVLSFTLFSVSCMLISSLLVQFFFWDFGRKFEYELPKLVK